MEKIKLDKIVDNITAIVPIYVANKGKASKIYLKDGKTLIDSREAINIVKDIAAILAVDLGSLKKFCSHRLAIKNALPLPLLPSLMFVPLRVRKPLVSKDSATGYINFFSILDVNKNGKISEIEVEGDKKIDCYQTKKTVQVHLVYSRLIYREWQTTYLNPYLKEASNELYRSAKLDLIRNIKEDGIDYK